MSRGLATVPEEQRIHVAKRRVSGRERGLGYWSAVSFLNAKGIKTDQQKREAAVADIVKAAEEQKKKFQGKSRRQSVRHVNKPKIVKG